MLLPSLRLCRYGVACKAKLTGCLFYHPTEVRFFFSLNCQESFFHQSIIYWYCNHVLAPKGLLRFFFFCPVTHSFVVIYLSLSLFLSILNLSLYFSYFLTLPFHYSRVVLVKRALVQTVSSFIPKSILGRAYFINPHLICSSLLKTPALNAPFN